MSLAATLTTKHVADTVCSGKAGVFMHGPTFMANPLACAVANASIQLLTSGPWQERVAAIEKQLTEQLSVLRYMNNVLDIRVLGAIGVVEMIREYDVAQLQKIFVEHGVWIRPFGKLIYIMPPYVIEFEQLAQLINAIKQALQKIQ